MLNKLGMVCSLCFWLPKETTMGSGAEFRFAVNRLTTDGGRWKDEGRLLAIETSIALMQQRTRLDRKPDVQSPPRQKLCSKNMLQSLTVNSLMPLFSAEWSEACQDGSPLKHAHLQLFYWLFLVFTGSTIEEYSDMTVTARPGCKGRLS